MAAAPPVVEEGDGAYIYVCVYNIKYCIMAAAPPSGTGGRRRRRSLYECTYIIG